MSTKADNEYVGEKVISLPEEWKAESKKGGAEHEVDEDGMAQWKAKKTR